MLAVVVPVGAGFLLLTALWIYAIVDVIVTDSMLVRNLSKPSWLFLVLFTHTIGAIAWLLLGRPEGKSIAVGARTSYEDNPYRSGKRNYDRDSRWAGTVESTRSRPTAPQDEEITAAPRPDLDIKESPAVRERRLLEWEAELKKREASLAAEEARVEPADDLDT